MDTAKRMHDNDKYVVHVLVDNLSLKFANKLSCHRNAIFCHSVRTVFTELLFLFDFVNLYMIQSI